MNATLVVAAGMILLGCTSKSPSTVAPPSVSGAMLVSGALADSCIAESALALGPLILGMRTTDALRTMGQASAIVRDSSEDDGGWYTVTTYRFASLEFDDVRGNVDRLAALSSVETPWHGAIGLSRDSVSHLLALKGVRIGATDTVEVPGCGAPSAYLTLAFATPGVLSRLEMSTERP